jgi:pilus assembly protein CpaE
MSSLPVILIGIDEESLPDLRRELFRDQTSIEASFSHAGQALDALRAPAARKTRQLLIMEWRHDNDSQWIKRLSDSLPGWPILALIAPPDEPLNVLQAYRSGASRVVPLPFDSLELHDALTHLDRQFGGQHGENEREHRVIAVSGSAGGCGSTVLAINLAYEIAGLLGRETILGEMNVKLGSLTSYLDLEPRGTLVDLLRDASRVDDYLVKQLLVPFSKGLHILAGANHVHSLPAPPAVHLLKIVERLRMLSECAVLDLPCTYQSLEFDVLSSADQILLIGIQNVPSVRSLKLIRETLSPELVAHSLWVILNRYDSSIPGFHSEEIKQLLDMPRVLTVADDYAAINRSINQGRALRQVAPRSPVLDDLDDVIHKLLGLGRPTERKTHWGRFSNLLASWRG